MVHVLSCRFLRLGCSEDEHPLFRREYARSNREKGVKASRYRTTYDTAPPLLRCFPHCCPEHVKRSYCGCSVHLLVTFSADVRTAALDDVLVATRFEPSQVAPLWSASLAGLFRDVGAAGDDDSTRHENERKLGVGESVQLPKGLFASSAGPLFSQGGVWVRAEREGESMQRAFPKNTVLFVINKSRFPKWFYNYDSSTTRAQREMTHHLVAYVFRQCGEAQNMDPHAAVVLARHPSPAFHLVSFRRSGITSNDSGCELSAVDTRTDNAPSKPSHVFDSSQANQQHQHQEQQQQRDLDESRSKSDAAATFQQTPLEIRGDNIDILHVGDIASLRQQEARARDLEFRERGQHLLVLWKFLRCVSLADVGVDADIVGAYLMRTAATGSGQELEHVSISFLNSIFERPMSQHHQSSAPRVDITLQVAVRLFLRAASSCCVEQLLRAAIRPGNDSSRQEQPHEQFVHFVSSLYDVLDDMLHEFASAGNNLALGNQDTGLPALVDAILSLVYDQDQFRGVRPEISALLDHQRSPEPETLTNDMDELLQAYTVQIQELQVATATRLDHDVEAKTKGTELPSGFSRRWVLDPQSIQAINVGPNQLQDVLQDFRVIDVVQFIREAGCVDVEMDATMPSLNLQSVLSSAHETATVPALLIMDGRLRVFHVLPSGLSSAIVTAGGWSIGDYAGTLSDDAQSLSLDFFAFAEGYHPITGREIAVVRRVSLTLTLEQEVDAEYADSDSRTATLLVHAMVYGSALRPGLRSVNPSDRTLTHRLSTASASDRAVVWSGLKWTPLMEMQAEYLGLALARE